MKSSIIKTGTMLAGFLLAACLSTHAEVKLPAIFSDGMVMQQQTNANLWGTAIVHYNSSHTRISIPLYTTTILCSCVEPIACFTVSVSA